MSEPIQVNFPTKKPTPGDLEQSRSDVSPAAPPSGTIAQANAAGQIVSDPTPAEPLKLIPFDDGMPLKYSKNPNKAGTFVVHDRAGTPFALTLTPQAADLIANAVALFFVFQNKSEMERLAAEQAAKLTDAIVADCTNPATE